MNWVIWKRQTLTTLSAHKGVKRHIKGLARMPPAIPKFLELHILTSEELKKVNELELLWDKYD